MGRKNASRIFCSNGKKGEKREKKEKKEEKVNLKMRIKTK